MRVLVTGGAGFIGSHVVDAYVAAGHEVVVVDNLSTGRRANVNPAATFYRLDLYSSHLDGLFRFHAFDVVNHHAARVNVRRSMEDPMRDIAINVGGTIRLLELCRRHRVRGVIFASSGGAIYGDQSPAPTPEDAVPRPASPHGISKMASEGYVDYYRTVHGLPAVVLRYANVYGPRQDLHGEAGIVADFCNHLLDGQVPVVCGDGEQTRDFVYVGDVALANLRALDLLERQGINGNGLGIFNIGTGQETTVNALLASLADLASCTATPLREGLLLTLEWFERSPAADETRNEERSRDHEERSNVRTFESSLVPVGAPSGGEVAAPAPRADIAGPSNSVVVHGERSNGRTIERL